MQYKFNDSNIVIGYIKELLKNFNLPIPAVKTDNTIFYDGRTYIDGSYIVKYNKEKDKLEKLSTYIFGKKYVNIVSNFNIKSSLYDTETHEYLGNYLRFIRDYKHINLMPLYNCFSNRVLLDTTESFILDANDRTKDLRVDTTNSNFIYYLVPVKFNQDYTIAINSCIRYELTCVLYRKGIINQVKDEFDSIDHESLMKETHTIINGSEYSSPYIFSTKNIPSAETLWPYENCLYLLIKFPSKLKSSIVILEGNYLGISDKIGGIISPSIISNSTSDLKPTTLSLLSINNSISYPFADRLVEYLLFNAITSDERIEHNIERLQRSIALIDGSTAGMLNDIWSDRIKSEIYKFLFNNVSKSKDDASFTNTDTAISYIIDKRLINDFDDILCYGDKDVEYQMTIYRGGQ